MRQKSQQMAFCGVLTALAVTLMLLGGLIPMATYCCPVMAMALLQPIRSEYGSRMAGAAYGAAALLTALLAADKELAAVYVFFGWYPVIKPWIDHLSSRLARLLGRLVFCNTMAFVLYALLIFVFQLESVAAEYADASRAMLLGLLLGGNTVFLLTDAMLTRLDRLWRHRLRRRFFRST